MYQFKIYQNLKTKNENRRLKTTTLKFFSCCIKMPCTTSKLVTDKSLSHIASVTPQELLTFHDSTCTLHISWFFPVLHLFIFGLRQSYSLILDLLLIYTSKSKEELEKHFKSDKFIRIKRKYLERIRFHIFIYI